MKVVILAVILAATELSVNAQQSIGTQRNQCTGVRDGSFVEDAESCWSFFVCYNEVPVKQICKTGHYFNRTNGYCQLDTNRICPQPSCSVEGAFSAHPTNCNLFHVCYQGELVEESCGEGSYFEKTNLYCLPDTRNLCPQTLCNEDGTFIPHATDCNAFYICHQGQLLAQNCGVGRYFNRTRAYCLPDTDNVCPQKQCNVEGAFSPHPTNCNLFYVCYQGELIAQSCGKESHFDKRNLYCLPDKDNVCPSPQCTVEGAFSPHPTECASFYICNDGLLVEQNCGNGSYFDKTNMYCLPDTNNTCWAITPTPTPGNCTCAGGYTEGEFVADPEICHSYYICSQGELVKRSCGTGNYFDNSTKRCERDTNDECWPTNPPLKCTGGYEEGDLVENSDSCSSYFICTQGELIAGSCGKGNYFEKLNKSCVPDTDGVCWSTTTTPAPCTCPGGYKDGDLVESTDSCSSYFICTQGELISASCGADKYFDSNSKTCVSDTAGICWPTTTTQAPCTCPGGYQEGDLVSSDSCSSYFICTQGELISASCGADKYFDSNSKTCVSDTAGICWPTTTTPAPCTCPGGYQEGDLVSSDSCSSYFICTQGVLILTSCGADKYFDSSSKTCVTDTGGVCCTTTTTPAPCTCPGGYQEGDLVSSDSCSSYFICTQGVLILTSCGADKYFDSSSKTCVTDTGGVCCTTTTTPAPCTCPGGYHDGDFVKNSESCSGYYTCVQGNFIAGSCGTGYIYDDISKSCVSDINNECSPASTTPSTEPPLCPGGYKNGDVLPYSGNPLLYYICENGKLVEKSCEPGDYFDEESKTCTFDTEDLYWKSTTTASMPVYNCSDGYDEGELLTHPENCRKFYFCSNGQLFEESCGSENYFDVKSKNCVLDTNNLCRETVSTTTKTTPTAATEPGTATPYICPDGYEEGDLLPHPGSCSKYYFCLNGELFEESCGSENYFDVKSKNCVLDTNNLCRETVSTTTKTTPTAATEPGTATPYICPDGYEEGDLLPHPGSCSKYYFCLNGELFEESCGSESYFDVKSKSCVLDINNICWETVSTTTQTTPTAATEPGAATPYICPDGYEEGDLLPHPGNCSKYYFCLNGELFEQSCGSKNYFDIESRNCVLDINNLCWETVSTTTHTTPTSATEPGAATPYICPDGYEEGDLLPHPGNCSKYYFCLNGELFEQSCGSKNYFDIESRNCVLDINNLCWETVSTTTQTTPTPATEPGAATPYICPDGYEEGDLLPHPGNCSKYYFCLNGELFEQSCGSKNYFDIESRNCVLDINNLCWETVSTTTQTTPTSATEPGTATPYICPDGYEEGDLLPHPGNCSKYYFCLNGELFEQSCGSKNYFDIESRNCVLDINNLCWKTVSTTTQTTPTSATEPGAATPYICPDGYEEGDLLPHPGNCSKYYFCLNGELFEQSCGSKNYFDIESRNCVLDINNLCWETVSTTTQTTPTSATEPGAATPYICPDGYEEGDLLPHPGNCSKYYFCLNGELFEQSCGSKNYFDIESRNCVLDINNLCWQTVSTTTQTTPTSATEPGAATPYICPDGYEEGDLLPHPGNCSKYYFCLNGELFEQSCGSKNYFDIESRNCVLDINNLCWKTVSTTTQTTPTSATEPGAATPYICPDGYEEGDLLPHPGNCSKYYFCLNGELFEQSCGSKNYFDIESRNCVLDINNICWETVSSATQTTPTLTTLPRGATSYICPDGYEEGDLLPHPGNCSKYYFCLNGELFEQSCGSKNYFDVESKSCVLDTTDFCWKTETIRSTKTTSEATPSTSTSTSGTSLATDKTTPSWGTPTHVPSTTTVRSTTAAAKPTTIKAPTTVTPYNCSDGYEEGEFLPYPGNCSKFYFCFNGELYAESCGYDNYFDVESKNCVLDTTDICWKTETIRSTQTTSEATPPTSTSTSRASSATDKTTPSLATPTNGPSTTNIISTHSPTKPTTTQTTSEARPPTSTSTSRTSLATDKTTPSLATPTNGPSTTNIISTHSPTKPTTTQTTSEATPSTSTSTSRTSLATDKTTPSWGTPTHVPSTTTVRSTTAAAKPTTIKAPTTVTPYNCSDGYEEGEFLPYPGNCSKFYFCFNGELYAESCGYDNYFDVQSKSCVLDTTDFCWKTETIRSTQTTSEATPPTSTSTSRTSSATDKTTPSLATPTNGPSTTNIISTHSPTKPTTTQTTSEATPSTSTSTARTSLATDKTTPSWGTPTHVPSTTTVRSTTAAAKPTTIKAPTTVTPYNCSDGYEEGEFLPYPGNCSKFYFCFNGELYAESCGYDNYFDVESKSCVLDTTDFCWKTETIRSTQTTSEATPPTSTSTSRTSSATDKTTPSLATPTNGPSTTNIISTHTPTKPTTTQTTSEATPSTSTSTSRTSLATDKTTPSWGTPTHVPSTTTVRSTTAAAKPTTIKAPTTVTPYNCSDGYEEGEFLPYPGNCSKFYFCFNGELYAESCGYDNYFDVESKSCVLDTTDFCWKTETIRSTQITLSPTTPTPSAATTYNCSDRYEDGELLPHPRNCSKFYFCFNGELFEELCGYKNYFEVESKSCVLDLTGICWKAVTGSTIPLTTDATSTSSTSAKTIPPPTTISRTTHTPTNPAPTSQPENLTHYFCPGGYEEGEFVKHSDNCSMFFICFAGELFEESCGYLNYFEVASKSCVLDTTGICWKTAPSSTTPPTSPFTKVIPTSQPIPNVKSSCPGGYENGEFVPHLDDCSLFYVCYQRELSVLSCGVGNYFDETSKRCKLDTSGNCWKNSPTISPLPSGCLNGLEEKQLIVNPSSCSSYILCFDSKLIDGNCGSGNLFNNSTKSCEADTWGNCWPTKLPTATSKPTHHECLNGLKEGQLTANPSKCYLYNLCHGGEIVVGHCGAGNYFNNVSNACEVDNTGYCWPVKARDCLNGLKEKQLIVNPSICSSYILCFDGKLIDGNCGNGLLFNNNTKRCEVDNTGYCWPLKANQTITSDCSNGLKEGLLTVNPSSCSSYIICYQGKIFEGYCGTGNYFNSDTRLCEPDTSGRCWPTKPPSAIPRDCLNGLKEGQLTANPDTCYLYYLCYGGQLMEGHCGTGNYFNNVSNSCEPDNVGYCWPTWPLSLLALPTSAPKSWDCENGLKEGQLTVNPSACNSYIICYQGKIFEGYCGTGNYFNNGTNLCEPDTRGYCRQVNPSPPAPTATIYECPNGLKEGQLTANPSKCYLYNVCYGGEIMEGNCGTGNYFNNVSNACEPDNSGDCWPRSPLSPLELPTAIQTSCEYENGLKEGELATNPSSCSSYIICYGGKLLKGNCGTGNYFNNNTNLCEPDTGGYCWPGKPAPTARECSNGLKEGQMTVIPSSCSSYIMCYGGKLLRGNCGTGNFFNNNTRLCERDTWGYCWPVKASVTARECPNGLKEGQLTTNPSSCSSYIMCYGGKLLNGNCGTGNYFNNSTSLCEPDNGGYCWPIKPSPTASDCPNGLKEGQLTTNPSSCSSYIMCYGGKLLRGNCGTGNYFNNVSNICEPDSSGRCWPKPNDCSGGHKTGALIAHPGECDKFFICNDGELIEQDCGVGYLFDVNNKYCTADINGSCWAVDNLNKTCIGAPDGTFLPNEAACDKFFFCYNNTKILQECGLGMVFDSATLSCGHDTHGTCWKKLPNVCANTITGAFVPNPYSCEEYFICHQKRAMLQKCPSGSWFNPALMICQPDVRAECVNVCQGTSGMVNLAHPKCNQFFRCLNGLTTGVETCPAGTNFDATDSICKTTALCETDLCYKSTNGAVHPVLNDVTSFYTCFNQLPVKLYCPDGTAFDSELLVCTPDTGRCIGQRNGHLVPSHNNPNAYYECRNNMAIFKQCPRYAIFDERKRTCVNAKSRRIANNICSSESNGTMLPGATCNKFHLCLDGINIEQNCGAFSSFNQKLNQCVFNTTCYDEKEICIKSSDIEKFPDARNETSFIKCKRGQAVIDTCPKNMIYSHDIGYCAPRDLAMTPNELDKLCGNVPDNTLSPALDCRKFYICQNRQAILQQCAIDQYFDAGTGTCQPDVERKCWMKSETLRKSYYLKTVCHEGDTRSNPNDCEQFELCTYGLWLRQTCPKGQYFNSEAMMCTLGDKNRKCFTPRSTIECFDDMPLRASEKLCTDYYRCVKNQWKIEKCPIGKFFSQKTATCSTDVSACIREPETRSIKEIARCSSNETKASDVNCGIYHVCHDGEWWYRYCEEGTYFNKTREACVPNDGTCVLITKGAPCKNGTAKKSDFDPCSTYYLCVDGNWTTQHCPAGHNFNESHKACMLAFDDRPCKVEHKNVTATCIEGSRRYKSTNCTAFEVCSFGKWLSVACHSGFYYDTALELCIKNRGECSSNGLLRRECADNTFRANENNCSEFYYCSRNEWHLESCLEDFQYNVTTNKCIATNVTCPLSNQTTWIADKCIGIKSGSYVSHETDCTKYYLCIDDQVVEANCSYGKFYDKDAKLCQLNDGACPLKAQADSTICDTRPNGAQVQNPANCSTFFICSESQPLLSYCSPGMYFNADLGVCQIDTGICNKPRLCENNPGAHLPHETYCNIYYSCVRGVAIPVACEEDQIFDPIAKKCIADVDHRCVDGILVRDEVCSKAENGAPLVDPEDCTKYIVCTNGLAQTIQCPQGQFFDSSLMFCMPDDGSCPFVDGPNLPNNNTIPPDPIACIGKHGDLMPDPEHCNEFYICIYGNLRHDRCFDGEYFDSKTYSCRRMPEDDKCSTAVEMSTLCETSEDGMNFADQTDCRKYYQCNDAELQSKKCRTGESFDTLLGFCRQNDGTCLLENGQRVGACAGKHGKLAVNTENCRGYFTCVNGQKISDECENGEYFDKLTIGCEKDVNNTCRPVEDEFTNATQLSCTNLTELVFYPNVLDGCKTFFQCVKGTPRVHKCPDDLLFNSESGTCDWKDYVKCIDMTEHLQKEEPCLNATNGTRFGNPEDNCDSYFICTDGNSKNFKCGQGLKYNVKMEKCDLAANVNCTVTA